MIQLITFFNPEFDKLLSQGNKLEEKKGIIPDVNLLIKEFELFIKWEGPNQDIPTPEEGCIEEYDKVKITLESIKKELNDYLQKVR